MPQSALEKRFFEDSLPVYKTRTRLGVFLGPLGFAVASVVDAFHYQEHFYEFLIVRLAATGVLALLTLATYARSAQKIPQFPIISLLILYTIAAGWVYPGVVLGAGADSPHFVMVLLVVLATGIIGQWKPIYTIILSSLVFLTFGIPEAMLFGDSSDTVAFIAKYGLLLAACIIAITNSHLNYKLRFQQYVSRLELEDTLDQLKEAQEKLLHLDRMKTRFFANVSHELRTPLTLTLAPLESMLQGDMGKVNATQREYMKSMQSNSLRLLKLINNLLDLAKIEEGKMELRCSGHDIGEFINEIVDSVRSMAEKKGLELTVEIPGGLLPLIFDGDKMEKVLLNLLSNALKFTPKGRIRVFCRDDGEVVSIGVADTGIGIAEKHIEKIFDRFAQVDEGFNREYEGTGIGLALAKEIVNLHGGTIRAESRPGCGTTMTFTLPKTSEHIAASAGPSEETESSDVFDRRANRTRLFKQAELAMDASTLGPDPAEATEEVPAAEAEAAAPAEEKPRVLVVEDNPDMRRFLRFVLAGEFDVVEAGDGEEALSLLDDAKPELILSDIMMPRMDGYELCRELKGNPRTRHLPVVLLTSKAQISMKIEGLEKGADDYLTKPFSPRELKARVRSLLNLRRLEAEIQKRNEELEAALTQLKETQSQLLHSEKMASIGQLTAGVAHEMNNPLNYANSALRQAIRTLDRHWNRELPPAEAKVKLTRQLSRIEKGVSRTLSIITELRTFSRKDVAGVKRENIHAGIDATLSLMQAELEGKIEVVKDYGLKKKIECNLGQLNQVFTNLLHNAVEAVREKGGPGRIEIQTRLVEPDRARIEFIDNGVGMPEEVSTRIFEPFFTTRDVGHGVGLGLSISHSIIEKHKGTLEVESRAGDGTRFAIELPFEQPPDKRGQSSVA